LKLNPTTLLTPDNWIAEVTPRDAKAKPFTLGLSAHLSEEQAWAAVEHMLRWRRVGPARLVLRRRHDTRRMTVLKDKETRERFPNAFGDLRRV
jgi:hypothetical protein